MIRLKQVILLLGFLVGVINSGLAGFHGAVSEPFINLPRYSTDASLEAKEDMTKKLKKGGVQLIQVGEDFMFVLPSDKFFYADSNHVNEHAYPLLNLLAQFIKGHDKEVIKVAGYTDNVGSPIRNVALSRAQAQAVVKYLWNQGLHTPMIYATGYGGLYPIGNNGSPLGRAQNRRIQITFRSVD